MRTKTLLLAAAITVAGLAPSMAATVYSQNVVGYINITVPAGKFKLFSNQLTNSANNVNTVLTNGVVSDPNGVTNTVLFKWNGAGYNPFSFFTGADAEANYGLNPGAANGWYDADGVLASRTLNQGSGDFLYNPSGSPITVTMVGQVVQGTNVIKVLPGFNTYSIVPPVSTNIDSALVKFPGQSDPNGVTNDVYFFWNGNGYNPQSFFTGPDAEVNFGLDPGALTGFYDADGIYKSSDPAFFQSVGAACFIYHPGSGTNTWTYSFNVQ